MEHKVKEHHQKSFLWAFDKAVYEDGKKPRTLILQMSAGSYYSFMYLANEFPKALYGFSMAGCSIEFHVQNKKEIKNSCLVSDSDEQMCKKILDFWCYSHKYTGRELLRLLWVLFGLVLVMQELFK